MPDERRSRTRSPSVRRSAARRAAATFALYEQGLTQAEVGQILGIRQTAVSQRLRRAGLLPPTGRKPRVYLTTDDYATMQTLRDRGLKLEAIARRFDTKALTVGRHTTKRRAEGNPTFSDTASQPSEMRTDGDSAA